MCKKVEMREIKDSRKRQVSLLNLILRKRFIQEKKEYLAKLIK